MRISQFDKNALLTLLYIYIYLLEGNVIFTRKVNLLNFMSDFHFIMWSNVPPVVEKKIRWSWILPINEKFKLKFDGSKIK